MAHNPQQNIKIGNWLLDVFGVARDKQTPGAQLAAYAAGAAVFIAAGWLLTELAGRQVRIPH